MTELKNITGIPGMDIACGLFQIHSETRQSIARIAKEKKLDEKSLCEDFIHIMKGESTKENETDLVGLAISAMTRIIKLAPMEESDFLLKGFINTFQMELDDFVPEARVTGEEGKIPTLEEILG